MNASDVTGFACTGDGCDCLVAHPPRRVVLTGGPGAGKTAVLELVRRHFCRHVQVLAESAGIVYGGGFPRMRHLEARRCGQRAIFRVQRELENLALAVGSPAVLLCDRGTMDGIAYWPGEPDEFLAQVGTTREMELARYDAVIHLRVPTLELGYNHANQLRLESPEEAAAIDRRIEMAWAGHPRRFFVESTGDFLDKATHAIAHIHDEVPACCRHHAVWLETPAPRQ